VLENQRLKSLVCSQPASGRSAPGRHSTV